MARTSAGYAGLVVKQMIEGKERWVKVRVTMDSGAAGHALRAGMFLRVDETGPVFSWQGLRVAKPLSKLERLAALSGGGADIRQFEEIEETNLKWS